MKKSNTKSKKIGILSGRGKPLLFIAAFAVVAGGWMAYKSMAASVTEVGCNKLGTISAKVDYYGARTLLTNRRVNVALSNFSQTYYKTLVVGSTGPCVVQYQKTVNRVMNEAILKVDGVYKIQDRDVTSHIQNWLQSDGLGVDVSGTKTNGVGVSMVVNGKVDPITWTAVRRADDLHLLIRNELKSIY